MCRMLRLEYQSSAALRMQPYPRAPDHVWPGHLHGTGWLSARAINIGFPTVVGGARLVLMFALPSRLLIWVWSLVRVRVWVSACLLPAQTGARGVCGWMQAAPGLRVLGWGSACACLGAACRAGGGYEGRGVAPPPPFSVGGCGVCPPVGWDVAPRFLVGLAGGARGVGFRLYPAGLALVVWRVVLSGLSLTPARWVWFPRLGCVVALCGAGGPSPVPGSCLLWCGSTSSTWVVVRPCLSSGAELSPMGGCVRVAVGGGFPPPCSFFFPASSWEPVVGRVGWSRGGLVVAVACPRPPPPPTYPPHIFFVPVAAGMSLSWQRCVPACLGCLSL